MNGSLIEEIYLIFVGDFRYTPEEKIGEEKCINKNFRILRCGYEDSKQYQTNFMNKASIY